MKTIAITAILAIAAHFAVGVLMAKSDTIASIKSHNAKIEIAMIQK
ncbi:hypothetical protein [Sulfurimonas indica]|nr:hypothetical protein [Sulfurimonas indica]